MSIKRYLPANIQIETECGRILVIKRGYGRFMVVRHKYKEGQNNTPMSVSDRVIVVSPERFVLEVKEKTKKDLKMRILGAMNKNKLKTKHKPKPNKNKDKDNEKK